MTIYVSEFIQSFRSSFFDLFFNLISFLGEESVYILLLSIIYFTIDKKKGELLSFTMFFTGIFNNTIKGIVDAPRPFEKYPDKITNLRPETSTGSSFPSGHTQIFSSFWMSVYLEFRKRFLLYIAIIFSILMALSRLYLGVHFLEDVLVSIVLGFGAAYLIHKYVSPLDERKRMVVYVTTFVLFLPFVLILNTADLYKTYGLLIGFIFALLFEHKYVRFEIHNNLKKNCVRVVLGLLLMLSVQLGFKVIFDFSIFSFIPSNVLDMIRYTLITFLGLGVYPILFPKFNI